MTGWLFWSCCGKKSKEDDVIQLGIAFPGRREVIEINRTEMVLELKKKVEATVGIPVDSQEMVYLGKVLKNKRTLKSYKLITDRTVTLRGDHSSYIKMKPADPTLQRLTERMASKDPRSKIPAQSGDGDSAPKKGFDIHPDVFELTSTFNLRFGNRHIEGITIGKQRSMKELGEEIRKTLKLSSMNNFILVPLNAPTESRDSFLNRINTKVGDLDLDGADLEVRSLMVSFKVALPEGSVKAFEFDRDDPVSKLIDALIELKLPNEEHLVLLNEGVTVPIKGTLRQVGIVTGAFLDLRYRSDEDGVIHVRVNFVNDSGHLTARIHPEAEMWDLMKMVEVAGGGNAQRMILIDADGNELDEESSVKDWCVQDGAVLQVRLS